MSFERESSSLVYLNCWVVYLRHWSLWIHCARRNRSRRVQMSEESCFFSSGWRLAQSLTERWGGRGGLFQLPVTWASTPRLVTGRHHSKTQGNVHETTGLEYLKAIVCKIRWRWRKRKEKQIFFLILFFFFFCKPPVDLCGWFSCLLIITSEDATKRKRGNWTHPCLSRRNVL